MKTIFILLSISVIFFLQGCSSIQENISSVLFSLEMKRSDIRVSTVKLNAEDIEYLERKGQGPAVILLHGFSSDKTDWIRFIRYLPENYHVIALDLPGHGNNIENHLSSYDPLSLTHGIADVIDALELEKFHLAGNSLGGLVSKLYANAHPDRVISLGLFNSAGVTPPVPGDFYDALQKGDNPFDVKTKADWENLKTYALYRQPFIPWPVDTVMAQKHIKNNAFYQKIFQTMTAHPTMTDPEFQVNILENLTMPVLVIWGDKDRILNVSSVDVYSKYIKNLQTFIIKDCGHVPMIEMPEVSAQRYAQFIRIMRLNPGSDPGRF